MIAACQERMGTVELMELGPLLLKSDAAAVGARRVLTKLIDQENRAREAARANKAMLSSAG